MPARQTRPAARRKKHGWGKRIALLLLCLLFLLIAYMHIQARTVHVRYASVALRDLPEEFDGTKILYITDLNLLGSNTPGAALALLERLKALRPDLLLLGGDFSSPSLLEILNYRDAEAQAVRERVAETRAAFLAGVADFAAPLGKFAVAGEADTDPEALRAAAERGGVDLLADDALVLTRGGARLLLIGLRETGGGMRSLGALAAKVHQEECALVLAHSPNAIAEIQTAEAADGGPWADLVLCGHTRGGQVRLGGRSLFPLDEYEQRYLRGWVREGGAALLTSGGAGCQYLNLRLGSEAEVHCITLRRGEPAAPAATFRPQNPDVPWSPGG